MTTTAPTTDEAQIRTLIDEQVAAMRGGDADWLVARYTPDPVTYDLAPPLRHTGADVRDPRGLRAWFATFDGPVDYEVRDLAVTVGGDVAFCHSLNRLSATPRGMTEPFDLWFRSTVCLRKQDGSWRVAHEHTSTPFYMDGSFLAATDLLP
jgi:ketosteroid isomerase-like protein